jgi:tetratricopeptide (TPR) repeat protein
VTSPNQRTAASSLDVVRPVIARLDAARDPEDNAADILDAWSAAETSLRALLGGSSLSGQALVRELRSRQHLSLDQAHALLEFQAARDRANRPSYQPTALDLDAVRKGFGVLESAVLGGPTVAPVSAPIAAPPPAAIPDYASPVPPRMSGAWRQSSSAAVVGGLLFVLLALGGSVVWFFMRDSGGSAEKRGVDLYAQGRREAAKGEFEKAARDDQNNAVPHIYLGRIAREEGDAQGAQRELELAVRLDPTNYLAQRELASHLLAAGKFDLARRFYTRALELKGDDRTSQGFLGCTLVRLGRYDEARRWLDRAGTGDWSACAQQIPPPGAPQQAPRP